MSIHIEVPFDALSRPGVAPALAELVIALGGHGAVSQPVPSAAPAPAPAPVEAAPAPKKAKPKKAKAKPKRKAAPVDDGTPIAEQWAAYVGRLPEASQRFLNLLEDRGQLTVSEAVETLGLSGPKAMGGLTGAMKRWSPVALPFSAHNNAHGERCWVWQGVPA